MFSVADFGVAAKDRVYLAGPEISATYLRDPGRVVLALNGSLGVRSPRSGA